MRVARQIHLLTALLRPRPAVPDRDVLAPSVTTMRVRPTDLDIYLHVNNGTYLQMMDVARTHYIADIGGLQRLKAKGWYPVVAAQTFTYRRSLTLGQRFTITTQVVGWDERVVYLEQLFTRGEQRYGRGLVAGRFLARGSGERIPAPQVVELLGGGDVPAPELPDDVAGWARAVDVAHRA